MQAFVCANGVLTRCDAPITGAQPLAMVEQLGLAISELDAEQPEQARCLVCRPRDGHELFLAVHGMERQMHALVLWQHDDAATWIFAATPFDLVAAVEHIARYVRAMADLRAMRGTLQSV